MLGPENSLKSIDFTGPAPIAPPEYASDPNVLCKYQKQFFFETQFCTFALIFLFIRCESEMTLVKWRVTLNYANSPFKQIFKVSYHLHLPSYFCLGNQGPRSQNI